MDKFATVLHSASGCIPLTETIQIADVTFVYPVELFKNL